MSRILFLSSEAFPLVKTGGLADVSGSLPVALAKKSQDVRLMLPAYPEVLQKTRKHKVLGAFYYYNLPVQLIESRLPGTKIITWLVDCPSAFNRPGGPYSDQHGQPWSDNALRFAILCQIATDLSLNKLKLNWQPDIVHCNDWQTGLVPALLNQHIERPATLFTIHNLSYQGTFSGQTFSDLHLPSELWNMNGLEFYGQLSFIKGGLAYADKITTVSPTYANEILESQYSHGLDGLLNHRKDDLTGILNGIDDKHWNPGTDKYLDQKYNRRSLHKKIHNKTTLQKQLELPVDTETPMLGMVSRLVEQKGLDLMLPIMKELLSLPLQLVILGTGETHYETLLSEWAVKFPEKLKILIGYNEELSHKIEAASDIYLMPSIFEPCGLNQMYSLRYGTLPIVTAVGGLADTVIDANQQNIINKEANGFVLKQKNPNNLLKTTQQVINLYKNKTTWKQMQITAMSSDFSWESSAEHYISLYNRMLSDKPGLTM